MKTIGLTNSDKVVLVDDCDYEHLSCEKWQLSPQGYATRNISQGRRGTGKTFLMHRVILDPPGGCHVDHINGNGLDNQRCNIRIATRGQNMANCKKMAGTKSQFKGVCWDELANKWKLLVKGKHYGMFYSEKECAIAYNFVSFKMFGEFARFNDVHL